MPAPSPCLRAVAVLVALAAVVAPGATRAAPPPLLPETDVAALAREVSGSEALRTVQELTQYHRQRGSRGFAAAAAAVRRRAAAYGLQAVEVLELPADGEVFYGTQRSRPAWDADFAELWELAQVDGRWQRQRRIASWEERPITLAEDSSSGEVETELVDVGEGTEEGDYAGKSVAGKLVLAGAQPGAVAKLAGERGAVGIVSYAPNQRTGWWKEDASQVRWGHLATFPAPTTFAFMVSLEQARAWRQRLGRGETVRLAAKVRAGQHPGSYALVTGVIRGRDPDVAGEEIVYSCHLDHQQPGANDNASGCAAILEAARSLARLVAEGTLPPPRRTLRFVWPPEVEGTLALLNGRPELARRARAVVHLDMVGGAPAATGAVFHVTRAPASLPTFVNDVAEAFGRFVDAESDRFAATGEAAYPLVDPAGGKEPLLARFVDFTMGSDHEVWSEGSWRVPAIYLNDWPDRTIHTHADALANIDPTKLRRAAFLAAACGYYLARLGEAEVPALWQVVRRHAFARTARALARAAELGAADPGEAANLLRFHFASERRTVASIGAFAPLPPAVERQAAELFDGLEALAGAPRDAPGAAGSTADRLVYHRTAAPRGPMWGFGYSYLEDHLARLALPTPALVDYQGAWGGGGEYAYEALNLVDGRRDVRQVRDALAAIYGPLPLALVADYLEALEKIGVLAR